LTRFGIVFVARWTVGQARIGVRKISLPRAYLPLELTYKRQP
jgi:hypothetical protein